MPRSRSAPRQQEASPHLTWFEVEGYKAFGQKARIDLGRLTLILGRNNAGKTALCFAPLYFTHALRRDVEAPFPTLYRGVDFGALQSACFRRKPTGLLGTLGIGGINEAVRVTLGATALPEEAYAQFITRLEIEGKDGSLKKASNVPWVEARPLISAVPRLSELPEGVLVLRGLRPTSERYPPYLGHVPEAVGPLGEKAPMILAASGDEGLRKVNEWFAPLRVRLKVERRGDDFAILAEGPAGEPVNISDSGAGVAQALPLVVAIRLTRLRASLYCLEQPELHMHARAHVAIAELLLESLASHPSMRLLVETHSDVLVLRIRREIAAGRLAPRDVRIYFVDEDSSDGAKVKEIELNDEGTPRWWPKDVFAEAQREYFALRRELAHRRSSS